MYNATIAALEAFVLKPSELDKLTSFVCKRCRALVLGKAHSISNNSDGTSKHSSWSNAKVMERCMILPVHLELAVRRIKWLQSLVARPETGGAMLAAWLGEFKFENNKKQNPWVEQLVDDIRLLNCMEGWIDISETVRQEPVSVFNNIEICEQILKVDTRGLRATLLDKLEYVFVGRGGGKCGTDEPADKFVCQIRDSNGVACGFEAASEAALQRHQISSGKENHMCRSIVHIITITNQCCLCSSVFADRVTAQHHLSNSLTKGVCKADNNYRKINSMRKSTLCVRSRVFVSRVKVCVALWLSL